MTNISLYLENGLGIKLDESAADMINQRALIVNFPAGHIALLEGDRSSNIYYIIKGIVRGYYIDEQGNDITKCFCSENKFFSSEGYRTESASSFTIECLENCKCIQIPYELVHEITGKDMYLSNLFTQYYLKEVGNLENRLKNLVLMNAEERYLNFCKQYPNIYDRVELKYIASFIGIRPASLSRIRKETKNKGFLI